MRLHEKSEVFVAHGSGKDRAAHKVLTKAVDDANFRSEVRTQILAWAEKWLPEDTTLPPAFYNPEHPFWTGQDR